MNAIFSVLKRNDQNFVINLQKQLQYCSYTQEVKFAIEKALTVANIIHPDIKTDILSIMTDNSTIKYIQINGKISIQDRQVIYYMMFPQNFPQNPPYLRIVNLDPSCSVKNFYEMLRSPNDPKSYVLNPKLMIMKYWDPSKSISAILSECKSLLKKVFPFEKGIFSSTLSLQKKCNYNQQSLKALIKSHEQTIQQLKQKVHEQERQINFFKDQKQIEQKGICKVCLVNRSTYVNTKCGHLNVCQQCYSFMKGVCPYCRSKGDYIMVFNTIIRPQ